MNEVLQAAMAKGIEVRLRGSRMEVWERDELQYFGPYESGLKRLARDCDVPTPERLTAAGWSAERGGTRVWSKRGVTIPIMDTLAAMEALLPPELPDGWTWDGDALRFGGRRVAGCVVKSIPSVLKMFEGVTAGDVAKYELLMWFGGYGSPDGVQSRLTPDTKYPSARAALDALSDDITDERLRELGFERILGMGWRRVKFWLYYDAGSLRVSDGISVKLSSYRKLKAAIHALDNLGDL